MKQKYLVCLLVLIIMFTFAVSATIAVVAMSKNSNDSNEKFAKLLLAKVIENINRELDRPIFVGRTMANNYFLKKIIEEERQDETAGKEEFEKNVIEYLNYITKEFGYSTAFLISDYSKKYYTQKGFNKIVDIKNDPHDVWYELFINTGKKYDFDIDVDEVSNEDWTVFVNNRIIGNNGELLGVCGVGVKMKKIQTMLKYFQKYFNVQINLVDESGLVKVDIDDINIETAILDSGEFKEFKDFKDSTFESHFYTTEQGYVVSKYLKNLGFYLVIKGKQTEHNIKFFLLSDFIIMIIIEFITIFFVIMLGGLKVKNARFAGVTKGMQNLSDIYETLHLIDCQKNRITTIKSTELIENLSNQGKDIEEKFKQVFSEISTQPFLDQLLKFTDIKTLQERLSTRKSVAFEFIGKLHGWCRASFIVAEKNKKGIINKVIFAVQIIDAEKREQERLIKVSNEDQLTGLSNRRCYDNDVNLLNESTLPLNFTFIEFAVNSLKMINDTKGHTVGDELIIGASHCINHFFKNIGTVYRVGGDEFVVMLDISEEELLHILCEFEKYVARWKGKEIDNLSISYGFAREDHYPGKTLKELSIIADENMYKSKSKYYEAEGINSGKWR